MNKINVKVTNILSNSSLKRAVKSAPKNAAPKALTEYQKQIQELNVFCSHIYEYKKGVRPLVLTTEKDCYRKTIEERLKKEKIDFLINPITKNKINVFFGAKQCIDIVKTFSDRLDKLTAEQDFMLGIMLGYEKLAQCSRYLKMKAKPPSGLDNLVG
jgi:hypothetical protein